MRHTGIVHMAKSRPQVTTSAAGVWSVSMRVYDVLGAHQKVPWLAIFTGEPARDWWEREGRTLEPGDTLRVVLERARVHVVAGDRYGATAEIQAQAVECAIVARTKRAQEAST